MSSIHAIFIATLLGIASISNTALAEDINQLPKYGNQPKNETQKTADNRFLSSIDELYKGDRKRASLEIALKGWQFLRQNNYPEAMRRFNLAWLLDNSNGAAIWGMGAISSVKGKSDEALKLFAEAEQFVGNDLNFAVDYALTLGNIGTRDKNELLIKDALVRFARNYERAPQHTMNLQNWAIILFNVGSYTEAWKKIKLAEATPGGSALDKRFLAALQEKMSRP